MMEQPLTVYYQFKNVNTLIPVTHTVCDIRALHITKALHIRY